MALEMKGTCERCSSNLEGKAATPVYICSYECTYCDSCAIDMHFRCPNCSGELVKRAVRPDKK
ncbi:MAG: DUF1272 domain-containing protein [Deltaproteobacteria bacterium]|nr:DUF1272 domain-containing protein [Deltaproteobacteria bacterium]MBI3295319.1 DUF1272 domain-containing protein [Deltaproteobacteria bacterium]